LSIQATLCLIVRDSRTLLLKKSKGLFGEGRWSCPGGKILPHEEPKPAAIREVLEETRLVVKSPAEIGLIYFYNESQRLSPVWTVHTFLARQFDGVPIGGREGQLKWFNVDALPFDEMWEDDQYWYRLALDGARFDGWFYFSSDFKKLIDHRIEVKSPPSQLES